ARRSATTGTTGARSRATSRIERRRASRTASVPTAARSSKRKARSPGSRSRQRLLAGVNRDREAIAGRRQRAGGVGRERARRIERSIEIEDDAPAPRQVGVEEAAGRIRGVAG